MTKVNRAELDRRGMGHGMGIPSGGRQGPLFYVSDPYEPGPVFYGMGARVAAPSTARGGFLCRVMPWLPRCSTIAPKPGEGCRWNVTDQTWRCPPEGAQAGPSLAARPGWGRSACTTNADCGGRNSYCVNGKCVADIVDPWLRARGGQYPAPRCATDADCKPGYGCAGGVCLRTGATITTPYGSRCATDKDCKKGYGCAGGVCLRRPAVRRAGGLRPRVACIPGQKPSPCGPGETCQDVNPDTGTGTCKPGGITLPKPTGDPLGRPGLPAATRAVAVRMGMGKKHGIMPGKGRRPIAQRMFGNEFAVDLQRVGDGHYRATVNAQGGSYAHRVFGNHFQADVARTANGYRGRVSTMPPSAGGHAGPGVRGMGAGSGGVGRGCGTPAGADKIGWPGWQMQGAPRPVRAAGIIPTKKGTWAARFTAR